MEDKRGLAHAADSYSLCSEPVVVMKGHFVPKVPLGNILDGVTFALNF